MNRESCIFNRSIEDSRNKSVKFINKLNRWKMGKLYFIKLMAIILMTAVCGFSAELPNDKKSSSDENTVKPVVYMSTDINPSGLISVYKALGRRLTGKVAVKISTGEPGGHNYLSPDLIKDLVQSLNGTIVECNTAYNGKRANTAEHKQAAADHVQTEATGFPPPRRIRGNDKSSVIPAQAGIHMDFVSCCNMTAPTVRAGYPVTNACLKSRIMSC